MAKAATTNRPALRRAIPEKRVLRRGRTTVAVACAIATFALLGSLYWHAHRMPSGSTHGLDMQALSDPERPTALQGYQEVNLGDYSNRPENDFVVKSILPRFRFRKDEPVSFSLGLNDVTAQRVYMIFLQLTDRRFCDDGCRTLAYRWNGGTWSLIADQKAVKVAAKPGSFAYVTRDHGTTAWIWKHNGFNRYDGF